MPPKPAGQGFATRKSPRKGGPAGRITPRRTALAALVFGPLALLSGAYSGAVVLDTGDPQASQSLYAELPKAKIRLGDLTIAEAVSDIEAAGAGAGRSRSAPPGAAELAARLPQETRLRIEARALSGLADTPYAAGALRQLAFVESDPARRRTLLDLARRVSRRDVSAAAQVAELQFQDGDMAQGLATLDEALAISEALDARIFPLMLSAAQHREVAPLLRARFARDPSWSERLARHAVATSASAASFARVVDGFPQGSRARAIDYGAPLIDGLATNLEPAAAFAAYEAYSSGPQDPSAFGTRPLAPLDWRLVDSIDAGTRILRQADPVVELFAQARRRGEAARIMLRLDPGQYTLSIALADPRGSGGVITLMRACLETGRETALSEVATSLDASQVVLPFDVPADCPYQSLRLALEAPGEAISVLVDEVRLNSSGARP